ncbi:HlyD family secretion protein [Achromobacter pulmonis]|uniref:HlyD family secretion protein n=1 Tax=Achromobacter pulmonis TaxID=1389932 RepID=A0A2N8KNZ4_9BURK|nr:HlyD family efflux transporter periplasmic adaptor subunit [Achromobacter pulmonis]PND35182.1 HlyD family secretion protein [Achromobacter pulmonis]
MQDDILLLLQLTEIEGLARQADDVQQLSFHVANDAHPLLNYRQALVYEDTGADWRLLNVSGLVSADHDSPYLVWLGQARKWLRAQAGEGRDWLEPPPATAPGAELVAQGWREWWPAGAWLLPLKRRDGTPLGWAVYLLEQPPTAAHRAVMGRLAQSWSYSWELLAGRAGRRPRRRRAWMLRLALVLLAALCFLPVRQRALAPAEVSSLDLEMISAPLDGVVKAVHVRPNQEVQAGQLLFSLDDTTLSHRLQVAARAVAVADAEYLAASQTAFRNEDSRARLTLLQSRAEERRAELASIRSQLQRLETRAPRAGVAVFGDANDWIGKPVATGERIMQLADPTKPAMLIQLPASDAIALEVGAPVDLYLTVRPMQPLRGKVIETSYQAALTPEGVASYRLRASVDAGEEARIGLKGTARLAGGQSVLGFELIRRPLAALRAFLGL